MKKRNSSIELLKIIAMFMIALNHGIQSTNLVNGCASANISIIILTLLRCCGNLGNIVFIICSSYFLLDSNTSKSQKVINIILDSFMISILWIIPHIALGYNISAKTILKQFFPLTFNNNWFVVCYLLLYLIHPYLNLVINNVSKKQLFKINIFNIIFYSFFQMITAYNFCYTNLVGFIMIYFIVAFFKKYMIDFSSNKKKILLF